MLTLVECLKIMKNFPVANYFIVNYYSDLLKLNFPYYMKVSLAEHKLEKNAVFKINNIKEAKIKFNQS